MFVLLCGFFSERIVIVHVAELCAAVNGNALANLITSGAADSRRRGPTRTVVNKLHRHLQVPSSVPPFDGAQDMLLARRKG
jgi:hypothetical protein